MFSRNEILDYKFKAVSGWNQPVKTRHSIAKGNFVRLVAKS